MEGPLRCWARLIAVTGLMGLAILAGCADGIREPAINERDEPRYRDAKQLLREGKESEALNAFLKVIDKRENAPESHLEAGEIYLDHFDDPVSAIYHYRQYLQEAKAVPSDEPGRAQQKARSVRARIDTATKRFAASLPGAPYESDVQRLDLLELVRELKQENATLKQSLAQARSRAEAERERARKLEGIIASMRVEGGGGAALPAEAPREPARRQPQPAPATEEAAPATETAGRTYTVQPQDSLFSISRKVYGSSGRWREIFEANQDRLASPDQLRVGQELRIPE